MAARAPFRHRAWRALAFLSLPGLLALLAASCATPPQPAQATESAPSWQTRLGQALWQPHRAAAPIAGELLLLTRPNGDFVAHFSKTPLVLVEASRKDALWQVAFPAQSRQVRGRGRGTPRLLWLWLAAALEGRALPKDLTWCRHGASWCLVNGRTGERLEGYLAP